MKHPQSPEPTVRKRILRLTQVRALTGLSRTGVYSRMASNDFPKSIGLGGRAVGWIEEEVDEWIEKQIAKSRSEQVA